jgi:hypothetical protein
MKPVNFAPRGPYGSKHSAERAMRLILGAYRIMPHEAAAKINLTKVEEPSSQRR